MFEEDVIERGTLDLNGTVLFSEATVAKHQLERFASVSNVKLCSEFFRKACRLKCVQHPHLLEQSAVVWQQRFSDMEAGEMFLFEHKDLLSGAGEERRRRAATGASADD